MRRRLRHRSSAESGVQDEWCAVCLDGIVPKAAGWRDSRFRPGIIQRRSGAVLGRPQDGGKGRSWHWATPPDEQLRTRRR